MQTNRNALSYWFPKIEAAGLPVPKTILVTMPQLVMEGIYNAMNGEAAPTGSNPLAFFDEIAAAADQVGWPCFLRTDHTSHKHNWQKTCFLPDRDSIPDHVFEIAEFSEFVGFLIDLPWDCWAVREMLPTKPVGFCPLYGGMPICREFRVFVDDGVMRCWHGYWPEEALEQGGAVYDAEFDTGSFYSPDPQTLEQVRNLAMRAGAAVGGSWSVDILETEDGWKVTDMAVAADSYHWEGCPHG